MQGTRSCHLVEIMSLMLRVMLEGHQKDLQHRPRPLCLSDPSTAQVMHPNESGTRCFSKPNVGSLGCCCVCVCVWRGTQGEKRYKNVRSLCLRGNRIWKMHWCDPLIPILLRLDITQWSVHIKHSLFINVAINIIVISYIHSITACWLCFMPQQSLYVIYCPFLLYFSFYSRLRVTNSHEALPCFSGASVFLPEMLQEGTHS